MNHHKQLKYTEGCLLYSLSALFILSVFPLPHDLKGFVMELRESVTTVCQCAGCGCYRDICEPWWMNHVQHTLFSGCSSTAWQALCFTMDGNVWGGLLPLVIPRRIPNVWPLLIHWRYSHIDLFHLETHLYPDVFYWFAVCGCVRKSELTLEICSTLQYIVEVRSGKKWLWYCSDILCFLSKVPNIQCWSQYFVVFYCSLRPYIFSLTQSLESSHCKSLTP